MSDDFFDKPEASEYLQEKEAEREKLNILLKKVFNTEAGKEVLLELRDRYINNSVFMDMNRPHEECVKFGYYREGQANVVRWIESQLKEKK